MRIVEPLMKMNALKLVNFACPPVHHVIWGNFLGKMNKQKKKYFFLATDPEDPGSIPGATRFSEK
jgi:hypothetical protein